MRYVIVNLFIVVFLLSSGGHDGSESNAAETAKKEEEQKKSSTGAFELNKNEPIYITSDWMEVDQKKSTITFTGRVVTVQGDMTMRSETLTANYAPGMKQIKQMVAEGKVHATQCDRVATGEKIVFDDETKTITLTGNPVMRQGNSQVAGIRIIYYTEEDRSIVEGKGEQRVRATVFPDELQNKDKDKDKDKDKGKGCPGKGK
jgi:lipopolysaccharide export system protein LptA